MDQVFRYEATNNLIDLVANMSSNRADVAAVWDDDVQAAYVFGGRKSGLGKMRDIEV